GQFAAFWCPYIPPGITRRARSRSALSRLATRSVSPRPDVVPLPGTTAACPASAVISRLPFGFEGRSLPRQSGIEIANQVRDRLETDVERQEEARLPPGFGRPHGPHRDHQALEAAEARADLEQPEPIDHGRHRTLGGRP